MNKLSDQAFRLVDRLTIERVRSIYYTPHPNEGIQAGHARLARIDRLRRVIDRAVARLARRILFGNDPVPPAS